MTVQQWVDREFRASDSDRTSWQISCVVQWANAGYKGSTEAATGTRSVSRTANILLFLSRIRNSGPFAF